MKILITGGAGFIGANLTVALAAAGHDVVVLDTLSPQIHGEAAKASVLRAKIDGHCRFVHGSVTDAVVVNEALQGCQAIIHLAAETGTGQSMYEITRYCDVNVLGTAVLLEAISASGDIKKVVVASSRAIHGEGKYLLDGIAVYPGQRRDEDLARGEFEPKCSETGRTLKVAPTDEGSLIIPSSIYGITKYNQEQMVLLACKAAKIAAIALRFQNVYGPGQSLSNPYTGILSIFSTRILNGNGIDIYEDGLESRDFVYIDDVVASIILALSTETVSDEAFMIGTGVPTSVLTVAETLCDAYGVNAPIQVTGAYRLGDIRHNFADINKANALLGFEPKVGFVEGVRRFASWVKDQPKTQDRYSESVTQLRNRGLFK